MRQTMSWIILDSGETAFLCQVLRVINGSV